MAYSGHAPPLLQCCGLLLLKGAEEDLRSVVASLRKTFGVDYIYCWHGLPAYWSGISVEDTATSVYGPELMCATAPLDRWPLLPNVHTWSKRQDVRNRLCCHR